MRRQTRSRAHAAHSVVGSHTRPQGTTHSRIVTVVSKQGPVLAVGWDGSRRRGRLSLERCWKEVGMATSDKENVTARGQWFVHQFLSHMAP